MERAHGVVRFIRVRRTLEVAELNRVRWVNSGASWVSSGSFGFVGLLERTLVVVGFIPGHGGCRWVHSGEPWLSSGLFGLDGFVRGPNGGRRVHSVSLGTFGRAKAFIWVR